MKTLNIKDFEYSCSGSSRSFIRDENLLKNFQPLPFDQFLNNYDLSLLKSYTEGVSEVCLEGGHIYADEILSLSHLEQLDIASKLRGYLADIGIDVFPMLFVDDFHGVDHKLHLSTYLEIAQKLGLDFKVVISEKSLVPLAEEMLKTLDSTQHIIHKDGKQFLKHKKKPLLKTANGELTCSMLDSALTKIKKESFACSVNVLPGNTDKDYKKQQYYTKQIIRKYFDIDLQTEPPFYTFLT